VAFRVFIDKAAEKDIDRLPKDTRKLVLEEIKELTGSKSEIVFQPLP
jgi:mRNA-degrading endonuclease RelE of RelBE toxin-antitoxin system